jgi:hypothetical protein
VTGTEISIGIVIENAIGIVIETEIVIAIGTEIAIGIETATEVRSRAGEGEIRLIGTGTATATILIECIVSLFRSFTSRALAIALWVMPYLCLLCCYP